MVDSSLLMYQIDCGADGCSECFKCIIAFLSIRNNPIFAIKGLIFDTAYAIMCERLQDAEGMGCFGN
jgi:hypothetical protein